MDFMSSPFFLKQQSRNETSFGEWRKFQQELRDVLDLILSGEVHKAAERVTKKLKGLEISVSVYSRDDRKPEFGPSTDDWFRLTEPGGGEIAVWWAVAQFGARPRWSDSLAKCGYKKCAKYFVKDRRDQRFCSDSHRYLAARQHKKQGT